MSANVDLFPCSHCRASGPSLQRKSGKAGRVTRTPWYRETVECRQCNVSVTARTPGNAIALWNRASSESALRKAAAPFYLISEAILAEAPADANMFHMFMDCEGNRHSIHLSDLRSLSAAVKEVPIRRGAPASTTPRTDTTAQEGRG